MATPSDPKEGEELTKIAANLDGDYGKGKWCRGSQEAGNLPGHQSDHRYHARLAGRERSSVRCGKAGIRSRRRCGKEYARFVELSNKGAQELGFADTGAMWRSKYDMPPDAFTQGAGPPVGSGAASVSEAARLRAHEAAREVRRRRAGKRPDPGASARQYLGAGLVEHLSASRARECRSRLTTSTIF